MTTELEIAIDSIKDMIRSEFNRWSEKIDNISLRLSSHESKIDSKVEKLEEEVSDVKKRVWALEHATEQKAGKIISQFWGIFWKVLLTALATGVLGVIGVLFKKVLEM